LNQYFASLESMELKPMNKSFRSACVIALVFSVATVVFAQRPRTTTPQDATENSTTIPGPPAAPASVKAKYEGGVFGYNKTMEGTVNFDDANSRFIFKDKTGKEILFIPYQSLTGAFGDTHKVQPAAATVAQNVPSLYALPAKFIKTKVQYLTLQYNDPDSKVAGAASFKLDNKDILDSVLFTLANKAGLTRRGEVFVRKKDQDNP
jgi:uncharacterized protein YdeI (BOF family)